MLTTTIMKKENFLNVSSLRTVSVMRLSKVSNISIFAGFLIWWIVVGLWKRILLILGLILVGLLIRKESNIWIVANHMTGITRGLVGGKGLVGEILVLQLSAISVVKWGIVFKSARVMLRSVSNMGSLAMWLMIAE